MFLAFLSYCSVDIILSPESDKNGLMVFVKELINQKTSNSAISAAVVLLVAAAGIPLGFFIYQIYFYIRWNSPFSRDGMFPPFIEGRMNDLKRVMDGISDEEITGGVKWRKDWIEMPSFRNDHTMEWRYIENYFTEITARLKDEGVNLYARYRYLMDLLHTLGAGLFGIYLGYLGYLLAIVKIKHYSFTLLAAVNSILFAILILSLEWEDKQRREDHNENKNSVKQNITVMYLLFICIILYLGSPSPYLIPYESIHLVLRSAIVGLVISVWIYSRWKLIKDIFLRELVLLIFIAGFAGILSQVIKAFIPSSYWNIGWPIWVFLVTNLIFIRNRQNTRDDLIALQNYTIKRCLALEVKTKDESMPVRDALIRLSKRLWF